MADPAHERSMDDRYDEAVAAALQRPGVRAPPAWLRPRLPPSIRETMRSVALLEGGLPEALAVHYLDEAPRALVEQRLGGDDPARALLWRPIDPARAPGLLAALDGACALLRDSGVSPAEVLGAESGEALLHGRPCALELAQGSLLASGLPLLGAGPAERAATAQALAAGQDPDAVLDERLGQHLVHELLHGRLREPGGPPPPWLVCEAAALWLQARARPQHVFPERAGEAVPGVSLFVLAGEGLAAAFGEGPLLRTLAEPARWEAALGPRAAAGLACAGLQDWLRRRAPPFARDALDAEGWVKLAWAAAGEVAGGDRPLAALLDRAQALGPHAAARALPSLVAEAAAVPWSRLAWWHREPAASDLAAAHTAVRALFQENAMTPLFVTRPAALPGDRLFLDVEACRLETAVRRGGVFGEPARWTLPPPLCRRLHARGARRVAITGARREGIAALADQLIALALDDAALGAEVTLAAAAGPPGTPGPGEGAWTSSPR